MEERYNDALADLKVALFDSSQKILVAKINEINEAMAKDASRKELLKLKEQFEIDKNEIEKLGFELVDKLKEYSDRHVNVDDKVLQEAIDKVDDKTIADTFNKDDSNSKQPFAEAVNKIVDTKMSEETKEEIKKVLPIIEEGKMSKEEVVPVIPKAIENKVIEKKEAITTPVTEPIEIKEAVTTPITEPKAMEVKEEKVLEKKTTPVVEIAKPIVSEETKENSGLVVHRDSKKTIAAIIVTKKQEEKLSSSKNKQRSLLDAIKVFDGLKEYADTSKALDNGLVQAITKDNKTNVDIGHIQNDSDLEDFTVKARVLEEAGKTAEAETYKKEIENYTNRNANNVVASTQPITQAVPVQPTTPTQVVPPTQGVMPPLTPTNMTNTNNVINSMVTSVQTPTNTGGSYGK
jgi:hypothetical protein